MSVHPDLNALLGSDADILPATTVAAPAPVTVAAVAGAGGGVSYDGSKGFDQLALWNPGIRSADLEIIPEKARLDARARDTLRNDAYVAGGAAIWKDSIVGARFMLNSKPETKILWGAEDEVWEAEFQEEVETKFNLWAESPQNWPDAARVNTLTSMVRLAVGVYTAGGEVVGTAAWMPKDGRPFRTAMQMIDADRLSDPMNQFNNPRIRGGVERDARGAPVAYHFRNTHPAEGRFQDWGRIQDTQWTRIAARKPWGRQMVLHIYEQMRPDQTRGISSMVTALTEMRMTKHFRKTELQRAVIAATFAASLESDLPNGDVMSLMGAGATDDEANPTTKYMAEYLAAVDSYSSGARNLHIDGAKIPTLPPGTKLNIQNPGAASPTGDKFEMSLLRHIAAALGVSYEQLSKDYTNTNYSSARAAVGEVQKTMAAKKKTVADTTANFIYRLWLEEAINQNALESLRRRNVPMFYEGLNAEAYSACEWIGAGQGQIDPLKETQAAVLKIRNGLSTKEAEIARTYGGDYRKVAKQIARERKLDEDLGNPSIYDRDDTDMENALSGTPQERES